MALLLGIDVGSSGCKATIINEKGEYVQSASQSYVTQYPKPGLAEQNPQDWYISSCNAIRNCLVNGSIDPYDIAALSIDGPAHNVALMNEKNRIIHPTIHWSDTRSIKQCQYLKTNFQENIFRITYHLPNPSWTLAQLLWLKENETDVWQKLRRIQVTKDYVRMRFTDRYATDVYDAIGTQMYDFQNSCWSEEICNILEFPVNWLPEVLSAVELAGKLTKSAADDTGLMEGTPVAVGSGDSVVEAFGVGAVEPGQCVVKIATSATVSLVTASPTPTIQTITYPNVTGKSCYSIAATNCGASTMRWFTNTFCKNEAMIAEKEGRSIFEVIDDLAAFIQPGCEGLIFHPYLMGERTPYWDPLLRGDFIGITSYHSIGHFARAIMEGVTFSLMDCFEVIKEMAPSISKICMIGGGTKSPVWGKILCDGFGLPLVKPSSDDAAYGSALLAGLAIGLFIGSSESMSRLIRIEREFIPDMKVHEQYEQYFRIYQSVTKELTVTNHKISHLSRMD